MGWLFERETVKHRRGLRGTSRERLRGIYELATPEAKKKIKQELERRETLYG